MSSLLEQTFMIKYNTRQTIFPIYSKVIILDVIQEACLIQNINNKDSEWVMRYILYVVKIKLVIGVITQISYIIKKEKKYI